MATFDTIAVIRRLEDAGLSRDAAEAVTAANLEAVDAAREAARADRDTLATRADLETGLAALETRLTWRVVGIVVACNAIFAAVLGSMFMAVIDRLPT